MLYLFFITVFISLTAAVNLILPSADPRIIPGYIISSLLFGAAVVFAVDGAAALFIRRALPPALFCYEKRHFLVSKKEQAFYDSIGLKKWKGLIPEWGRFTGFSKSVFASPYDPVYTGRFLTETCYGIVIHEVCIIVGFLPVLIFPAEHAFRLAVPLGLINAFLNALPLFILRYNITALKRIHKHNIEKSPSVFSVESDTLPYEAK